MTNMRKIKIAYAPAASNLGVRLCDYRYVVSFSDWGKVNYHEVTVGDGRLFCCHNNSSLIARVSVYLLIPQDLWSFQGLQIPLVSKGGILLLYALKHVSISKLSSSIWRTLTTLRVD